MFVLPPASQAQAKTSRFIDGVFVIASFMILIRVRDLTRIWQAHAAAAVLNFSENCAPETIASYLDSIISKLLLLLQVSMSTMIVYDCCLEGIAQMLQGHVYGYCRLDAPFMNWRCWFQNGKRMVQEGALTALASVADSSQVSSSSFCNWGIPCLDIQVCLSYGVSFASVSRRVILKSTTI